MYVKYAYAYILHTYVKYITQQCNLITLRKT